MGLGEFLTEPLDVAIILVRLPVMFWPLNGHDPGQTDMRFRKAIRQLKVGRNVCRQRSFGIACGRDDQL